MTTRALKEKRKIVRRKRAEMLVFVVVDDEILYATTGSLLYVLQA